MHELLNIEYFLSEVIAKDCSHFLLLLLIRMILQGQNNGRMIIILLGKFIDSIDNIGKSDGAGHSEAMLNDRLKFSILNHHRLT